MQPSQPRSLLKTLYTSFVEESSFLFCSTTANFGLENLQSFPPPLRIAPYGHGLPGICSYFPYPSVVGAKRGNPKLLGLQPPSQNC
jgi:hypothetical protein